MKINLYRLPGEAAAHPDVAKENATAGNRGAAGRANQTDPNSAVKQSRETECERGLYAPLAWAARKSVLREIHASMPGNSTSAQRARMLAAMREAGHVTTTEARLFLEVMNPSQRVTELRNLGAEIDTAWTLEPSEAGRDPHRQARYVLIPNQGGGITAELAGLLVLATVAGLLLGGVLR